MNIPISENFWEYSKECEQERNELIKDNWMELRYLPPEGFKISSIRNPRNLRPFVDNIPFIHDWCFSPRGRLGVSVGDGFGIGTALCLLDVYNKLWSGDALTELDFEFKDIHTYYLLTEDILILVEISGLNVVKQHIIHVDLETRKAEFVETVVHQFHPRDMTSIFGVEPWQRESNSAPSPHLPITINKKDYTALVSTDVSFNNRRFVYLVPLDPLNHDIQPMEFIILTEFTDEDKLTLEKLVGSSYHSYVIRTSAFSSANLLHFSPTIRLGDDPLGYTYRMLGVYLTIDVSKLTDIHNKPNGPGTGLDQMNLDLLQEQSMKLCLYTFEKKLLESVHPRFSCGNAGAVFWFIPRPGPNEPFYMSCHILQTNITLRINDVKYVSIGSEHSEQACNCVGGWLRTRYNWLNMHPCGSLLLFRMSHYNGQMYVRVACVYNNALASFAISKVLFNPNMSIWKIEGSQRMVFHGMKPIQLDENSKKALGTHEECMNLLGCKPFAPAEITSTTIEIEKPKSECRTETIAEDEKLFISLFRNPRKKTINTRFLTLLCLLLSVMLCLIVLFLIWK